MLALWSEAREAQMAIQDSRPLATLLTQIVSNLSFLLQTEIRLARAELSEKASQAANGGMYIGIAAVFSLAGLFILLMAAVRWLEVAGLADRWGYLLVGVVAVGIGIGLALMGANRFKPSALVPDRTIEQLKADYTVAKEHVS
jgi:uncharacterized membrane protein YqjE